MSAMSKFFFLASMLLVSTFLLGQSHEDELNGVLQKLDKGEAVEHTLINLSDINFATGTTELTSVANSYLGKVAKLLESASNINLLIKGHTDNTGSAEINEKLSVGRASAVQQYLIQQGVADDRLEIRGYGSSIPVAENQTSGGRAKNRRVELEILKKETVKTVQDIIVLRNGDRMGVVVINYDEEQVSYKQFSDETEKQVAVYWVEKIVFADGREVLFDLPAVPETEPAQAEENKAKTDFSFNPFAEAAAFHQGQFIVGAGLGVENNIGITYKDHKIMPPPVWLVMELPLKHNLGVGVSGGYMQWKPKSIEDLVYTYFTVASRLAYHLNLGEAIDLYGGVAVTGRFATMQFEGRTEANSLTNNQFDATLFAGLRYYFNRSIGVYGEYGDDNVACAKLGLAFRFGK